MGDITCETGDRRYTMIRKECATYRTESEWREVRLEIASRLLPSNEKMSIAEGLQFAENLMIANELMDVGEIE